MRIGLLVLSVGNFGNKEYYNLQEVGLARELDRFSDEVLIYRLVDRSLNATSEQIGGCRHTTMYLLPSFRLGSNGIPDLKKLDKTLDVLICFSDTQTAFPSVYRWCRKYGINLIPYIGVSRSHSDSPVKQKIIDLLFGRNRKLYKKLICLAKTPDVRDALKEEGIERVLVAPVGIDTERLHEEYEKTPIIGLKEKYGYSADERIVLFIGRMTAEKEPFRMLDIFRQVYERDHSFRLIMVGSGELSGRVDASIAESGLAGYIRRYERIPNKDIWELYRIADCFVNLNKQEIYGMVLLEAMYYRCRVIAWRAPGPEYIIEDGSTGFLTGSDEETVKLILSGRPLSGDSRSAVLSDFTWKKTAGIIKDLTD